MKDYKIIVSDVKFWAKIFMIYSPFVFLLIILKSNEGHNGDINSLKYLSVYIFEHGLKDSYNSGVEIMPVYSYILWFFAKIQESTEAINNNFNSFRNITIFFYTFNTIVLYRLIKNRFNNPYEALLMPLFYLLNIANLYNCIIWGQTDEIHSFLLFTSVISAFYRKPIFAFVLFIIALNINIYSAIFLPIILLLTLQDLQKSSQKVIFTFISIIIVQTLILIPFLGTLSKIETTIIDRLGYNRVLSMNAYNVWFLLFKGNLMEIKDTDTFIGITYKLWGFILFLTGSIISLAYIVKQKLTNNLQKILITSALIILLCFFFNTEMHERYAHPMLIFLAAYALLYKKYVPYILASVAYFLNLEDVLQYYHFENYDVIYFKASFIATLYLITIVMLYLDLFDIKFGFSKMKVIKPQQA